MIVKEKNKPKQGITLLSVMIGLSITLLMTSMLVNISKNSADTQNTTRELSTLEHVIQTTITRVYEMADASSNRSGYDGWEEIAIGGLNDTELMPSVKIDGTPLSLYSKSQDKTDFIDVVDTPNGRVYIDYDYFPYESIENDYGVDVMNVHFHYSLYETPNSDGLKTKQEDIQQRINKRTDAKISKTVAGDWVLTYRLERSVDYEQ